MRVSSFGRYVSRSHAFLVVLRGVCGGGVSWMRADESGQYHNEGVLKKYGAKLKIGEVKEEAKL